jgi:hypothetical protein
LFLAISLRTVELGQHAIEDSFQATRVPEQSIQSRRIGYALPEDLHLPFFGFQLVPVSFGIARGGKSRRQLPATLTPGILRVLHIVAFSLLGHFCGEEQVRIFNPKSRSQVSDSSCA